MMRIVCLDTQVLYWGILGNGKGGHEGTELIPRARDFLIGLTADEETHVLIPAIVVGELLAFVPEADQGNVLAAFQRDWLIADFNARAALVFGQMRANRSVQEQFKTLRAAGQKADAAANARATRRALVADCMIIATAIAHEASVLYSDDRALLKLADGWIDAKRFQDEPYQMRLIDEDAD